MSSGVRFVDEDILQSPIPTRRQWVMIQYFRLFGFLYTSIVNIRGQIEPAAMIYILSTPTLMHDQ